MLLAFFLVLCFHKFSLCDNKEIHLIVLPIRSSDNNIKYYKIEDKKITTTEKHPQSWNVFTQSNQELMNSLNNVLLQYKQLLKLYLVPVFSDDMRLIKDQNNEALLTKVNTAIHQICEGTKRLHCNLEHLTEPMSQKDEGTFIYMSLMTISPPLRDSKAYVYLKGSHLSLGVKRNDENTAKGFSHYYLNNNKLSLYSIHVDCAGPTLIEYKVAQLVINDGDNAIIDSPNKYNHPCYPTGMEVVIQQDSRAESCYEETKLVPKVTFVGKFNFGKCYDYINRVQGDESYKICSNGAICNLEEHMWSTLYEFSTTITFFLENGNSDDVSEFRKSRCNDGPAYSPQQCFVATYIEFLSKRYQASSAHQILIRTLEEIDYIRNYIENELDNIIEKFPSKEITNTESLLPVVLNDPQDGKKESINSTLILVLPTSIGAVILITASVILIVKLYKKKNSGIYHINGA